MTNQYYLQRLFSYESSEDTVVAGIKRLPPVIMQILTMENLK